MVLTLLLGDETTDNTQRQVGVVVISKLLLHVLWVIVPLVVVLAAVFQRTQVRTQLFEVFTLRFQHATKFFPTKYTNGRQVYQLSVLESQCVGEATAASCEETFIINSFHEAIRNCQSVFVHTKTNQMFHTLVWVQLCKFVQTWADVGVAVIVLDCGLRNLASLTSFFVTNKLEGLRNPAEAEQPIFYLCVRTCIWSFVPFDGLDYQIWVFPVQTVCIANRLPLEASCRQSSIFLVTLCWAIHEFVLSDSRHGFLQRQNLFVNHRRNFVDESLALGLIQLPTCALLDNLLPCLGHEEGNESLRLFR